MSDARRLSSGIRELGLQDLRKEFYEIFDLFEFVQIHSNGSRNLMFILIPSWIQKISTRDRPNSEWNRDGDINI